VAQSEPPTGGGRQSTGAPQEPAGGAQSASASGRKSLGARWRDDLSPLGKAVAAMTAGLFGVAILLGVIGIFVQAPGLFIALAVIPLVLAVSSMSWPAQRLRVDQEPKPLRHPRLSIGDRTRVAKEEDKDASMGELLEWTRQQAKAEDDRTGGFRAIAGWLLGFAGVIIALAGAQAQKVLDRAVSLGAVGRPLGTWLLGATIVTVGVAAFAALQALLPGDSRRIPTSQMNQFLADRFFERPRVDIRFLEMEKLIEQLETDRRTNEKRWRWLRFGFVSLAVALAFLVLHIGVFLERAVETPCPVAKQSTLIAPTTSARSHPTRLAAHPSTVRTATKTFLVRRDTHAHSTAAQHQQTQSNSNGASTPHAAQQQESRTGDPHDEESELPVVESESCVR
jgi:hypothetical protein